MFQTNEKKYGSKCSLQNPEVLAKAEATNEKLYGFKNPSQSPEIKAKVVATNIKNYGVTNVFKNPETNFHLEIDIVVISNGEVLCGIEYNGIYWHDKKNPTKEVTKSNLCAAQGFPLFHIWEDNIEEDFLRVLDFLEKYKNKDS